MVHPVVQQNISNGGNPQLDLILQTVVVLGQRLAALEDKVVEIHQVVLAQQNDQRQTRMESLLTDIRDLMVHQRTVKDWYSPAEVAEILGKKPYTVREWCRLYRVNARKRPTGRGDAEEWEISHEELNRIKDHGLLPIPTKY